MPEETSPSVLPARRDWVDVTVRLATSWVGLFTAYAIALLLALTKFKELKNGLQDLGLPPWLGIALIASFPLLAFVFSTVPSILDQRRIKRDSLLTGPLKTGYFTLRPRESEEGFERADNAHQEILNWVERSREPVLYFTGASGTGKSSLVAAWVLPNLERAGHVVVRLRGYEDVLTRIEEELVKPGVVWEKPPTNKSDLKVLLERASQRLSQPPKRRRLIIVVDQFEEFLILKDEASRQALQSLLSSLGQEGDTTFLLISRPEYLGMMDNQAWPKRLLDVNWKEVFAFSENAAQEFMSKSGQRVNATLMRSVLREAAEIEQGTTSLIRPVTINLCGLVLGRFASGIPRKFHGGLIRGFLRESLSLPEVRDFASKLIPQLITSNVTKQPRTIAALAEATSLRPEAIRACLRRLAQSDRAIVRYLDQQQETWEISHDFLVPLLDSIIARRTVSAWRLARPWLPWAAAAGIALSILIVSNSKDPVHELQGEGWILQPVGKSWRISYQGMPSKENFRAIRRVPDARLVLSGPEVSDVSSLKELKNLSSLRLNATNVRDVSHLKELTNLTSLGLGGAQVSDVSPLKELKNLTWLDLSETQVSDVSPLKDLKSLTSLDLSGTRLSDVSPLKELTNLTSLNLRGTQVSDVSALKELKNLTSLDLSLLQVSDVSPLKELTNLTSLNLRGTQVSDVSALKELKNLTSLELDEIQISDVSALKGLRNLTLLNLNGTNVRDVSPLKELTNLTRLYLIGTQVSDVSPLKDLKNLTVLNLNSTRVSDVSPLKELKNLTWLDLSEIRVSDVSALKELKNLTSLDLNSTRVSDVSPLKELKNLTWLDLSETRVSDVSALRELKNLSIKR